MYSRSPLGLFASGTEQVCTIQARGTQAKGLTFALDDISSYGRGTHLYTYYMTVKHMHLTQRAGMLLYFCVIKSVSVLIQVRCMHSK